jgi:hypothetical protein
MRLSPAKFCHVFEIDTCLNASLFLKGANESLEVFSAERFAVLRPDIRVLVVAYRGSSSLLDQCSYHECWVLIVGALVVATLRVFATLGSLILS